MTDVNVSKVLAQMRAMSELAQGSQLQNGTKPDAPDFSRMLKGAIDAVNENQKTAGELAEAFETGDPGVDLAQVMVAMQKASLSFQSMVQVRNKLLAAYQDIMNMPV